MYRPKPRLSERYLLGRLIGRGGVCVVNEAVDRQSGRRVAIKHLHEEHAHRSDLRMRLVREAEVLDLVKHPNVVSLVELVDDLDGTYVVLEYLDGLSLERIIRVHGKLSVTESIALLRQACHAVAAVHHAGIVHRDVKPSNLVVLGTCDLERSPLKLVDFGTATAPISTTYSGPKLTLERTVLGTAAYMPFEQIKGAGPSTRGDVYALGVTLYECLTGRVRLDDLAYLPRSVAQLVARAVAADPEVRFEDAQAMLEALDDLAPLLAEEPASGVHLCAPQRISSGFYR